MGKDPPDQLRPSRSNLRGPILIVEDDEDIRESIASVLADEGYDLVVAADGARALALLQNSRDHLPRLMLLDLMMPVMNATELRNELVKDEMLAKIPIVIFSGDAHVADKAAALGAVDVLVKPISLEKLLDVVARY